MSYFAPYIDETGYHYPTYNDILEDLVSKMQEIYGSGIYLGNDSQDYQLLSKFAEKIYDCFQTGEIVYHSHSPVSSMGAALDYIVAVNGIARKQGTKSTVTLLLTGEAGTTITNGIASDGNGYMWDLLGTVTIGDAGTVECEAVCRENGVVQAAAGSITRIMTPTLGWDSVTNQTDATVGTITETDSELRARQADSVAMPSQSMAVGMLGAVAALENVGRCTLYENDKGTTDANGIPGHSICFVVEGGDAQEIAETIQRRKGPGCGTYGSETKQVIDANGQTYDISFCRPVYVDIDIEINIKMKTGYTSSIPDDIKTAIVEYMDTFSIGTDLTASIIWMVAQQINEDPRTPQFSVQSVKVARRGGELGFADIDIYYNEVAKARVNLITVNVT